MSLTDAKASLPEAAPSPRSGATDPGTLEQAIRLYRELGFSEERAALTLVRNGYPSAAVRRTLSERAGTIDY